MEDSEGLPARKPARLRPAGPVAILTMNGCYYAPYMAPRVESKHGAFSNVPSISIVPEGLQNGKLATPHGVATGKHWNHGGSYAHT